MTAERSIGPRPLSFIRVRLNRGQADYLSGLLAEEKEALFEDLAAMRDDGLPEEHPKVQEVRTRIHHIIYILRDVDSGKIELVGEGRPA